jgi:hypothetical protein
MKDFEKPELTFAAAMFPSCAFLPVSLFVLASDWCDTKMVSPTKLFQPKIAGRETIGASSRTDRSISAFHLITKLPMLSKDRIGGDTNNPFIASSISIQNAPPLPRKRYQLDWLSSEPGKQVSRI